MDFDTSIYGVKLQNYCYLLCTLNNNKYHNNKILSTIPSVVLVLGKVVLKVVFVVGGLVEGAFVSSVVGASVVVVVVDVDVVTEVDPKVNHIDSCSIITLLLQ